MDNDEIIWKWLWERIGNDCGVAGLMGNLCAESSLRPDNLQNSYERALGMTDAEYTAAVDDGRYSEEEFCRNGAGYGLAQWSARERKQALYDFVQLKGRSIGDLETQLEFLWTELGSQYKGVLKTLLDAGSVREASDAVMLKYEVPADTSEANRARRAQLGMRYYERFALGMAEKEISASGPVMNEKAGDVVELAKSLIGCDYVFGALGEKRNGRQVFDCRGYTWYLLHSVGISISTVGATTQWNTVGDWAERGEAKDMPNVVCCVFKHRSSDGKMAHTGMHIGDGAILHCTENGGVKYGSMTDKSWTHYAIPKGLYTPEEIERGRGDLHMRTLRQGSSGEDVRELQERLNALGYKCGSADGVFGGKTQTAVKAFQSGHGLMADGVVGPATWAALADAEKAEHIEKTGTTENAETPAADGDIVSIRRGDVLGAFMALADALGYTVDARSGNVSPIDYQ